MAKARHDWSHWYQVFREISRTAIGGISQAEFCRREGLPLEACRKAFARLKAKDKSERSTRTDAATKWEALRIEFLEGDFKTLTDFAHTKGLNCKTGYFSRQTKGWRAQKAEIRAKTEAENVAAIADRKGAEAIAQLHSRVLTALYSCLKDVEGNGEKRTAIQKCIADAKDNSDFLRGVNLAIDALLKLAPAIGRIEGAVGARELLRRLAEQDIDVVQTAIMFEEMGVALPETVKILLGKVQPEEPDVPEDETPDDDELERRWREGQKQIDRQKKQFLPERQREIRALKEECKAADSFSKQDGHLD